MVLKELRTPKCKPPPPPGKSSHKADTFELLRDESNQPENPINLQQFWFSDQGYFLFQIFGDHGAQVGEIMNHILRESWK